MQTTDARNYVYIVPDGSWSQRGLRYEVIVIIVETVTQLCIFLAGSRYAIPTCQENRQHYERCRPHHTPLTDVVLTYPNGNQTYISEAYLHLCPCDIGYSCHPKAGYCYWSTTIKTARSFNYLILYLFNVFKLFIDRNMAFSTHHFYFISSSPELG